jgi:hypothetical protein
VSQYDSSVSEDIVDVTVVIDIPEVSSFGTASIERVRALNQLILRKYLPPCCSPGIDLRCPITQVI